MNEKVDKSKAPSQDYSDHKTHLHEREDGTFVKGDKAHEIFKIPLNATEYSLKAVRFVVREELQGKGPLASVMKLVERLQARIGKGGQVEEKGLLPKEARSPEGVRTGTIIGKGEKGGKVQAGDLSPFERVFFGRFKEGKKLEMPISGGKFRFLKKAEGEWKTFFQKFLPFTQEKRGKSGDLQQVVFRGLLKGGPATAGEKAKEDAGHHTALITDLKFGSGKTEKFARVPVGNLGVVSQILMKIASLVPGDFFSKVLFNQWVGGEDFSYLSLSYKMVRPDLARQFPSPLTESAQARAEGSVTYAREGERGIALSARTEEIVARELDLTLRPTAIPSAETHEGGVGLGMGSILERKLGIFPFWRRRRLPRGEGEAYDQTVFVPWYQLIFTPRKKWKGKPRWYVALTYFVVFSFLALAAFYLFKYWLQQ